MKLSKYLPLWGWLSVGAIALGSCTGATASSDNGQGGASTNEPTERMSRVEPAPFSADSAYRYLADQVAFGPRQPGTQGHARCGDWLVSQLKRMGLQVHEQTFEGVDHYGSPISGRNIIASLNPEIQDRLLLMAHWDTRAVADHDPDPSKRGTPILGADDGASGVAVLLELARQAKEGASPKGIDFAFFDLEDGGSQYNDDKWCQGSNYWAEHPHKAGYTAKEGILLDMVGARKARFHWEGYSKAYAAPLLGKVWDLASALGWGDYFRRSMGGELIDDHIPVIQKRQIPCIDIVNYSPDNVRGFGDHWHTHGDNLNIIDKATLRAVGETVATFISNH